MLIDSDDSQLILIDYQARLLPALSEGAAALANAVRLARAARLMEVPVWGTEQAPESLGATDPVLSPLLQRVFSKRSFSAVPDGLLDGLRPPAPARSGGNARSLPKHLQKPVAPEPGRQTLVLAGCEAHVCLLQTALDLVNEEFDVCVVTDACSSRTERNRDAAFDRLAGAGVELVTTEMVLFEWLRSSDHPQFKAIQALVK